MRYKLRLSYCGTAYHGWQIQENAHSVQAEIEEKLSLLTGHYTEITGCGRTDTGVHAEVYMAHFDTETSLNISTVMHKLNQMLPTDIAIKSIEQTSETFHARFDAISRAYEYRITTEKNPFLIDKAWYRYGEPDIQSMNQAAKLLLNHTDFECFSKVQTQVNHFNCHVTFAEWRRENTMLIFSIKADRFLRNMVRAIVGTLLEVGYQKMTIEEFKKVLESKNRSAAGQSVPAHGLYLTDILYPLITDDGNY